MWSVKVQKASLNGIYRLAKESDPSTASVNTEEKLYQYNTKSTGTNSDRENIVTEIQDLAFEEREKLPLGGQVKNMRGKKRKLML